MYIYAESVTPNGASARVHRVQRVEITQDVKIFANSFANDGSIMAIWQEMFTMPVSLLTSYPDSVYEWMTSASGPFPSGTILNSPNDLELERVKSLSEINRLRDFHIGNGVETPSGRVDSDPVSVRNIMGSYQSAALALMTQTPLSVGWRLANNTMVSLDAMGMIGIGNAVLTHVKDCYAQSWALKQAVEDAETVEEVEAVKITEGWPT